MIGKLGQGGLHIQKYLYCFIHAIFYIFSYFLSEYAKNTGGQQNISEWPKLTYGFSAIFNTFGERGTCSRICF